MAIDVQLTNLGELQRDLSAISNKLTKKELAKLLRPGIRVMQRAVKQNAPKRKGILSRSIKTKTGKGSSKAPYVSLWTSFASIYPYKGKLVPPYYAIMVHNGTIVGADGRRIRLKSYKGKAYDWMSGMQRQYQREADRAKGRQRIKPNPFVYEAFEANVQRVADTILSNIESSL